MDNSQEYFLRTLSRPRIVCLCGSVRFLDTFIAAQQSETLRGNIVLSITPMQANPLQKCFFDRLHLQKIELADEVLILNVGGYVGESTSRELAYAQKLGKVIRFWEPPHEGPQHVERGAGNNDPT